jgi:tetratricopeptide (TPR) repeat protein
MSSHLDRAQQLMALRRYDLAEKELREELAREPDSAIAHVLLADILQNLQRIDEARAAIEEAIRLAPEYAYGHYLFSFIAHKEKAWHTAERAIQEALRLAPNEPDYLGHLAFIRHQRGYNKEALRLAEDGLRHDASNTVCLNSKACALGALGRHGEAQEAALQALALRPESDVAFATLGWLMERQNRIDRAAEAYLESLRLDPSDAAIQAQLRKTIKHHLEGWFLGVPIVLAAILGVILACTFATADDSVYRLAAGYVIVGAVIVPYGVAFETLPGGSVVWLYHRYSHSPGRLLGVVIRDCLGACLMIAVTCAALAYRSLAMLGLSAVVCLVMAAALVPRVLACRPARRRFLLGYLVFITGAGMASSTLIFIDAVSTGSCRAPAFFFLASYFCGSIYVAILLQAFDPLREISKP